MGDAKDSSRFRSFAIAFLKEAKEDKAAAEEILENKRYSRAVYFCQQCVEKSVKALLEMEKIFVEEHDLSTFFVKFVCNNKEYDLFKKEIDIVRESLIYFKEEWSKTRYPKEKAGKVITPSESYEEIDAISAIEKSKEVLGIIEKILDNKFKLRINAELSGKNTDVKMIEEEKKNEAEKNKSEEIDNK